MVPRPRNKGNKSLPQNLYFDSRRLDLSLPAAYRR